MRAGAVNDATRDRHALMHIKQEGVPPLDLELESSLEHEKELVFVRVAVPVDELALDHGKANDAVIHARDRLIHPRFVPLALRGKVDLRQLTVLVVIPDVVVLHSYLPVVSQTLARRSGRATKSEPASCGAIRCQVVLAPAVVPQHRQPYSPPDRS